MPGSRHLKRLEHRPDGSIGRKLDDRTAIAWAVEVWIVNGLYVEHEKNSESKQETWSDYYRNNSISLKIIGAILMMKSPIASQLIADMTTSPCESSVKA